MGRIGNLGKTITFSVSSDKVLTFNSMSRTVKGRWSTHSVIGIKPRSEFLGSDIETISLRIKLMAQHGVKPLKMLNRIHKAINKGTPLEFVLGGKKVGNNRWVITNASESWDCIFAKGELVEASVTLTLQEYL